ncbi:Phage tail tube, TTP, lambda-like [Onishia taeanensis]|uniref:Phage tail tube, TTP, lambda-like n=1 Tax=Onishia taeanensis TaxID=284577 RepID=A0A1G7N910_9GAMM|nr:phage tail tube protein [Halomonas taeanensis]SDF69839.1 Phage tail tube, TTP, lambda-like [Halomonas taeanensis]
MSVLAQGTHVFFIDDSGSVPVVVRLKKVTALNPGTAPAAQLDKTSLEDELYRQYRAGLRNPGQGSMSINADPSEDSHIILHGLSEMTPSPTLKWAIGWSDGTGEPSVDSAGDFDLPTSRTWCSYEAYVSDFPFDFQLDALVATEVGLQRSGGLTWQKKEVA